ncbi:hypothetical protein BDB01DRAFT_836491 [Pilobolus umbonatus]|nr:hypothetical protein BDB01DRAFT_836491 [Pilobolus umbonatus]
MSTEVASPKPATGINVESAGNTEIPVSITLETTEVSTADEATKEIANKEEAATEVVEDKPTEDTPAKSSVTKRRTIFNPFAKTKKEEKKEDNKKEEKKEEEKEEEKEEDKQEADEVVAEVKPVDKKKSKGFTFFSRSKSTKGEVVTEEVIYTELPQIGELQPIEPATVNIDPKEEVVEEESAAEIKEVNPDEVQEASASTPVNKRQSFIAKLFNKKKQDKEETVKEVIEEEKPVEVKADVPVEQQEELPEEKKEVARPSSPLGRITEFFKKDKKQKPVAEVEEVSIEKKEEETVNEEETGVTANTATPAAVVA